MGLIVVIIVLGVGIGITTFIVVRNLISPKKIARVDQLLKQNKATAAIRLTKQILAKDNRNPAAHYALGRAYMQDGKPELALMEFKAVNQLGNFEEIKEGPFRRQLAELFRRYNQPDEALKEYLLLIQKDAGNADAYFNVGELLEERNKAAKAVNYYRKTIELKPGHGMAYLRLGTLLYKAKRFPEAKTYLEKALRFEPDHYEPHYFIGRILKEQKDFAGALKSLEWATKAGEYKVRALIERGTAFMEMGQNDRAVPELERAIAQAGDDTGGDAVWAHYFLASCYEGMRKIDKAIEHWEAVYRVKPGFQDVSEKLSQFQELRQDDFVKDFLTASQPEFRSICEKITIAMGLSVQSINDVNDDVQVIAIEPKANWRTTRKQPRLIRFVRAADMIDETTVREVHEEMRTQNLTRAVVVASSTFSRMALDYAESRPLDLINKDKLQQLAKKL